LFIDDLSGNIKAAHPQGWDGQIFRDDDVVVLGAARWQEQNFGSQFPPNPLI